MNITDALESLVNHEDLSFEDSSALFNKAMQGELSDAQFAGLLMGLRVKGETADELAGAAATMRSLSVKVEVSGEHLVDTCGTGGSGGAKLFNISTASAFVAAASGAQVAKHGNRAMSSKSGSADVLEAAGVSLNLTPAQVAQCIRELGVGFMFAQAHHSAMRHAAVPRRELGIRTMMNVLGPMTNPANAKNQIIGVFAPAWQSRMIEVLRTLGSERALTVHSSGLDEFSIASPATVVELHNGEVRDYQVTPEEVGLKTQPIEGLTCSSPESSLSLIREALTVVDSPAAKIVAFNAGAALYVAGVTNTIKSGVELAQTTISERKAAERLSALADLSQSLTGTTHQPEDSDA